MKHNQLKTQPHKPIDMSKIRWEFNVLNYETYAKAYLNDGAYLLHVWEEPESEGWLAGVNGQIVTEGVTNQEAIFNSLELAKACAEMLAEKIMQKDGVIGGGALGYQE